VRAIPVQTATVQQKSISEELSLTGTLKPRAAVQVVSEVPARLLRLLRDEGAAVSKGEVIAVLDDTDTRLLKERASAAAAVAEANREHAVAERDRANNLLKTGGITDKDHLAAQVNLQVAEASWRQAKAEVAIAAQQLARCAVRAPFSGRVAKRLVDVGTMLAVGTPVVMLVDNSVLEFRASVPSSDLAKVRVGSSARVTVDSMPGMAMQGAITRILPTVDERSRSFEVVVNVSGQPNLISGLFGRAQVKVREIPNAIVVPPSSVVHDGTRADMANVFVVENNKAESRQVTLGYEGADAIEVRSGLKAGTVVVVDPPTTLASGASVQMTKTTSELGQ
jgi:membrane fusion protein (multidrug efflux system)/multidrug efflux system membrane fusion protein/cobalt-zinc-cadmium efflux system membrane fusion protein